MQDLPAPDLLRSSGIPISSYKKEVVSKVIVLLSVSEISPFRMC